jgi:hypothetical protein
MPDSTLQELITELQADDPEGLAHTIQQALAFARDHLVDAAGGAGSGALDGALDQIAHAQEVLQQYRVRLEELARDLDSIETDLTLIQSGDAVIGEDGEIGLSGV